MRNFFCPICGADPDKAVLAYTLCAEEKNGRIVDEVRCGTCGKFIGAVPSSAGGAFTQGRSAWNTACANYRG